MIKYCEYFGKDPLVSITADLNHDRIGYDTKLKIVDHIISEEASLGLQASSWKHCLFYLLHHGHINQDQFEQVVIISN